MSYRERLRTPWWWYPIALVVGASAGRRIPRVRPAAHRLDPATAPCFPLSAVIVWSLGRGELKITRDELYIRGAHLPLRYISGAVALDAMTLAPGRRPRR